MTHIEVRKLFKDFFSKNHHTWMKSEPLVPANDPSLLFVNAGMNPFKNIFLGISAPPYPNMAGIQKCLRAGGKHNDLDQIGPSPYHHTFFEMMGNFSFGGYFKETACRLSWEFLTKTLGLPKENMAVSVFKKDQETADIWHEKINIPKEKIFFFGEEDNFWRMGGQGPCGPCSEIYFDPQGFRSKKNTMFEIWNLVFMQYQEDQNKNQTPLSRNCIDTGMGLERLITLLQNKSSNYHTDLFSPLLDTASQAVGVPYEYLDPEEEQKEKKASQSNSALRVLADHTRSAVFLIADGVQPSNEGRGYVLRRILRRAIYHGARLTESPSFLHPIAERIVHSFSSVYPELKLKKQIIRQTLGEEEEKFSQTLRQGELQLKKELSRLKKRKEKTLSGSAGFQLYDTYGFPFDLVELICNKQGIKVQTQVFEKKMQAAREKSRTSSLFNKKTRKAGALYDENTSFPKEFDPQKEGLFFVPSKTPVSKFTGYETLKSSSRLLLLFNKDHAEIRSASSPGEFLAVFDQTPCYAEGGGQIGDRGALNSLGGEHLADILDCQNTQNYYFHKIFLKKGKLKTGTAYDLQVSKEHRQETAIHHSATHLLHSALRLILGKEQTKQAGSLVEPHRLRFDFTSPKALSEKQIDEIEDCVNKQIEKSIPTQIHFKNYDQALADGALSFFDKPQAHQVRVLQIGDFSMELCGGTHVQNTKDISYFKIMSEGSVGSGIRRIEAVCGKKALEYVTFLSRENLKLRKYFHLSPSSSLMEPIEKQAKQIQKLKKSKTGLNTALPDSVENFKWKGKEISIYLNICSVEEHEPLIALSDQLKQKFSPILSVLLGQAKHPPIVVSVPKILSEKIKAGAVIQALGGKGGGPPSFAKGILNQSFDKNTLKKEILKLINSI